MLLRSKRSLCAVGALAVLLLVGLPQCQPFEVRSDGGPSARAPAAATDLLGDPAQSGDRPIKTVTPTAPSPLRCEQEASDGYRYCLFGGQEAQAFPFLLHVPAPYDPRKKYPLLLLLHGVGERASPGMTPDEGRALLTRHRYVTVWVSDAARRQALDVQSQWPSFVVVPQLTYPSRWVDVPASQGSYQLAAEPTSGLQMAKELVDVLQQEYAAIDAERLYVTGISMGGYGTWEAVERWPRYFAAAVPVSGAGDPSKAYELKNVPLWAFHGAADPIAPVSGSREMVAAARAAGAEARYTEYAEGGHDDDLWARVYAIDQPKATDALFRWLFAQHKNTAMPHQTGETSAE